MVAASPKGTVPVLVLPDGTVNDESLEIMQWALRLHDPEGWLEGDDHALIAVNDGPFKFHLDRYKYPERHQSDAFEHREAALKLLLPLEERLSAQRHLCGERRSLADVAIMPFIRQFAKTDRLWFDNQPLPGLQRWLADLMAAPLFDRAMVKFQPWTPDDPPTLFC